ncbi:MBL fold metallo-hydrolase [Allofustis seminis]|uniref:MBL fold metallo-hydrolase n=1 Tax=Allofustis seminis TaxID=166939 RepID=UPI00037D3B19|nr:MBL fold metallo-hydrolase [Allofustis seminis]
MIDIQQIVLGDIESNCYILSKEQHALIVDPGFSPEIIIKKIKAQNVTPLAILLTHTHYDHIGAVDALVEEYQIPVYVAPDERDWLTDAQKNLSARTLTPVTICAKAHTFNYQEIYHIGPFTFQVVHTPGHSPGGVCFIFEEGRFVITGDALFAMSVGRTDFPGSEPDKQIPALRQKILSLPDDYKIYPGHRHPSTIGKEKRDNPFFQ